MKNESGKHIKIEDFIEWTSTNSPVTIFSNQGYAVVPKGAVDSLVLYGKAHGRLAGKKLPKNIKNSKVTIMENSISMRSNRKDLN